MKNLSLTLNLLLIIAVGILYYLHFSEKKTIEPKPRNTVSAATINGNTGARSAIAYVELDSLYDKISYIKDKKKELEIEQKGIESDWESGYRTLESQKNEFLKKGSAITQEEAQKFQGVLVQQQEQIDAKKQALTQKLNEKSYKFMDDIQKSLKDFLAEYNTEKNYMYIFTTGTGLDYMVYKDSSLNITNDVIAGMNQKMKGTAKQ